MNDENATTRKLETNRGRPDLAALASQAAITLDRKARGIDVPVDSVHRLVEFLRGTVEAPLPGNAARLLDPLTADVLSRAFAAGELHGIPQLKEKANEVIERLEAVREQTEKQALEELRDFCIALSRSAQSEYIAAWTALPQHPFRR